MARLEFEITGNVAGLSNADRQARGILNNLQKAADGLTIKLFGAETQQQLNSIGGALQIVTGKIKEYITEATKGSQAFKDQQVNTALTNLNTKISVLTGTAQIFGASLQNNQQQIKAYQAAIASLLSNGVNPFDDKIKQLKSSIDALNASSAQFNTTDPFAKFKNTGSLIQDAENKLRRLQQALKAATSERDIALYNVRITEATANLGRLNSIGTQTARTLTATGTAAKTATTGYNQFGTALSYIIQDAPYAAYNFGAIGNNITQAAGALPGYIAQLKATIVAQGGVVTSGALVRAGLAGLVTGFGGVIIAISAITSAFTIYQQYQQRAARLAEEQANALQKQKQALENYLETASTNVRASAQAASNYAEEVTKLDLLYNSLIKNQNARYGNVRALEELQKTWPQEFGNLQTGKNFVDQLSDAYEKLRVNIVNSGLAKAAENLSAKATEQYLQNNIAALDVAPKLAKAQGELNRLLKLQQSYTDPQSSAGFSQVYGKRIDELKVKVAQLTKEYTGFTNSAIKGAADIAKFNKAAQDANASLTNPVNSGLVYDLEQEIKLLQEQQPLIKNKADLEKNVLLIKQKQAELDELLGKNTGSRIAQTSKLLSLNDQLDSILAKIKKSAGESGLEGYRLELRKILDFYGSLNAEINKFIENVKNQEQIFQATGGKKGVSPQRGDELISRALGIKQGLADPFNKEIADTNIKEAERVANEIQRINDAFGVKSEQSRNREIASIEAFYDRELAKAKGNEEILAALREGRLFAIEAVNQKYLAQEESLLSKIDTLADESATAAGNRIMRETDRIKLEYEKRRKAAVEYYNQLRKITPENSGALNVAQQRLISQISKDEKDAQTRLANKPVEDSLRQATSGFVRDLANGLFNVSQQTGANFQTVFSSITASFANTIQNVVVNRLADSLARGIDIGLKGLTPALQGAIGALAIAGGLVSSLTPKTSKVGQGVGGALSGAATGAVIGSAVPGIGTVAGAVVGGVVGFLGGLFGASAEEKRIQEQQLAEQKRQTELLRQSIAYTSSVIGRMTANGIITNVDVGSQGQLVATVSGKDIQFVLDRTNNGR